jgi:hypothetical protein
MNKKLWVSVALTALITFPLPAIADSTIPVVQFTIGFGEKVDMQKIYVLGLRAGSDYAINAVEEENKKSNKSVAVEIVLGVIAAAAILNAVASNKDDKPRTNSCDPSAIPPGAVCN